MGFAELLLLAGHGFQVLRGLEGAVGVAALEQRFRVAPVQFQPLALSVGTVLPTDLGPLVRRQAEPTHRREDPKFGVGVVPVAVGVLEPEDEAAAALLCQDVVEQPDVGGSNVGISGRRGGDSGDDSHAWMPPRQRCLLRADQGTVPPVL